MANQYRLFSDSLNEFVRGRKSELLSRCEGLYPGDGAPAEEVFRLARFTAPWDEFNIDMPELVGDSVTLEPFDRSALPAGIPGPAPDPSPMCRVRLGFTGDPLPLRICPTMYVPVGGWPEGWVSETQGAILIELPAPVYRPQVESVCRDIEAGIAQLHRDFSLFHQPLGWLVDAWRERHEAAERRRRAAERSADQIRNLGYPVLQR